MIPHTHPRIGARISMATLTRRQTDVLSRSLLFFTICHQSGMTRKQAYDAFLKTETAILWGMNLTVGAMWELSEMAGYDLNKFETN